MIDSSYCNSQIPFQIPHNCGSQRGPKGISKGALGPSLHRETQLLSLGVPDSNLTPELLSLRVSDSNPTPELLSLGVPDSNLTPELANVEKRYPTILIAILVLV